MIGGCSAHQDHRKVLRVLVGHNPLQQLEAREFRHRDIRKDHSRHVVLPFHFLTPLLYSFPCLHAGFAKHNLVFLSCEPSADKFPRHQIVVDNHDLNLRRIVFEFAIFCRLASNLFEATNHVLVECILQDRSNFLDEHVFPDGFRQEIGDPGRVGLLCLLGGTHENDWEMSDSTLRFSDHLGNLQTVNFFKVCVTDEKVERVLLDEIPCILAICDLLHLEIRPH
mmetsp:Transcript_7701/g.15069  ORF Transcript_7701/g.15069 Transcript_7701/m.15069 type:complete len:224 (-) Transcript_7701:751-1422(-)